MISRKTSKVSIAYVVPTKDHPEDLRKMLTSLEAQTLPPDQVIIVDGSDPDVKHICDAFPKLRITYVRCYPPSLAKQRNAGMAALNDDITIAGYLDDDLVLEPDATEKMIGFWEKAGPDVGGAAMTIINQGTPRNGWLLRFFGMDGAPPGDVLPSGFACTLPFVTQTIETKWLYGGATLWRCEVIKKFDYDEWYIGHGYLEDLDYSYRVGREYRMFLLAESKTYHFSAEKSADRMYDLGRQQTLNRLYFVRKMDDGSSLAVAWALFGQVFMNLIGGLKNPKARGLKRVQGNLVGLLSALRGRQESFAGFWK